MLNFSRKKIISYVNQSATSDTHECNHFVNTSKNFSIATIIILKMNFLNVDKFKYCSYAILSK